MIQVVSHPLLDLGAFRAVYPSPLRDLATDEETLSLLSADAKAPMERSEDVRTAVRSLLRHGGYKPTGRGKPASEYLARAASEGALSTINAAVDAINAVSLHSGLPISVVDEDRLALPLSVAVSASGERFVFNPSGQEIDVGGLLCLRDASGPCANAVKDSQRTKTSAESTRALFLVWGTTALPGHTQAATAWLQALVQRTSAECKAIPLGAE